MQNEKTPRSFTVAASRYDALGSRGWPRRPTVLDAVDERLRMLDTHAERERLRLQPDAQLLKHRQHVARRVPCREHHVLRRDLRAVGEAHSRHPARGVIGHQRDDARPETKLHADTLEPLAQRRHHLGQPVRADVRSRVDEDVRRRAVQREQLQHVAHAAALVRTRVQLAVAVRPRASLAEAVVAVAVDHAVAIQPFQVVTPRLHALAAVDDDRADAVAREPVGAEQPRRPVADDHDARRARHLTERRSAELAGRCLEPDQQLEAHAPLASVDRAPSELHDRQGALVHAQRKRRAAAQACLVVRLVERKLELQLRRHRAHGASAAMACRTSSGTGTLAPVA